MSKFLKIDLDLAKLTVLVGPNASGKTAALESIGYLVSSQLDAFHNVLGASLTTTLRPREYMPQLLGGAIVTNNNMPVASFYIEILHPIILETRSDIREMFYEILNDRAYILLREVKNDMNIDLLLELERILEILRTSRWNIVKRKEATKILLELIKSYIKKDVEFAIYRRRYPGLVPRPITESEVVREISRMLLYTTTRFTHMKFSYVLINDSIVKSIIIETRHGLLVIKEKNGFGKKHHYMKFY